MRVCTEDSLYLLDGKLRQQAVCHPSVVGSQAREAAEPGLALLQSFYMPLGSLKFESQKVLCLLLYWTSPSSGLGRASSGGEPALKETREGDLSARRRHRWGTEKPSKACAWDWVLQSRLLPLPSLSIRDFQGSKLTCLPGIPRQASRALR